MTHIVEAFLTSAYTLCVVLALALPAILFVYGVSALAIHGIEKGWW